VRAYTRRWPMAAIVGIRRCRSAQPGPKGADRTYFVFAEHGFRRLCQFFDLRY